MAPDSPSDLITDQMANTSGHPYLYEDYALRREMSANVVGFCRFLRSEGLITGYGEQIDALQALDRIWSLTISQVRFIKVIQYFFKEAEHILSFPMDFIRPDRVKNTLVFYKIFSSCMFSSDGFTNNWYKTRDRCWTPQISTCMQDIGALVYSYRFISHTGHGTPPIFIPSQVIIT